MAFAPISPNHAIERCTATVAFLPNLPDKSFIAIADESAQMLARLGFSAQQMMTLGFRVGPGGRVSPQEAPIAAPRVFQSATGGLAITISPQGVVFTTGSYVRWQPFIGELERLVIPMTAKFRSVVSVSAVRLEYWDRFVWAGDWTTFRARELIRDSSSYVAPAALTKDQPWHSHTGWFDRATDKLRRLVNINIDVSELIRDPHLPAQPSVGIYSSLMEQANVPDFVRTPDSELDDVFIVDRLEKQHVALKEILGDIIVEEMATRVSLNLKKTAS
jgi:uncharacterized protein (TIGR04255 family)